MKNILSLISFLILLVVGALAIQCQWGLTVLLVAFFAAGVLGLVVYYFSNDRYLVRARTLDAELRALRIRTLANAGLMVLLFILITLELIAVGLAWSVWIAVVLAIAWAWWFSS